MKGTLAPGKDPRREQRPARPAHRTHALTRAPGLRVWEGSQPEPAVPVLLQGRSPGSPAGPGLRPGALGSPSQPKLRECGRHPSSPRAKAGRPAAREPQQIHAAGRGSRPGQARLAAGGRASAGTEPRGATVRGEVR